jgi:hypothetical protein
VSAGGDSRASAASPAIALKTSTTGDTGEDTEEEYERGDDSAQFLQKGHRRGVSLSPPEHSANGSVLASVRATTSRKRAIGAVVETVIVTTESPFPNGTCVGLKRRWSAQSRRPQPL